MQPTSYWDCECSHPRDEHPCDRACISEGCDCAYYDGSAVRMVHLVETDEGW